MVNTWNWMPADPVVAADRVDVWRIRLDLAEGDSAGYHSLLTREERERAQRYKFPAKRREFIVTRGVLRKILGNIMDVDPAQIELSYTDSEKPYLADPWCGHRVTFNVSHSHDMALIAVTLDRDIGIDIEKRDERIEFEQLAERFFSKNEFESLQALPEQQLAPAFYACWTRKEAFVKALGKGIVFGLSDFSVSVDPHERTPQLITHWDAAESSKWSMVNIDVGADYYAALAIAGNNFDVRYWEGYPSGSGRGSA